MKTRFVLSVILIFLVLIPAMSQTTPAKVTDSNTALHLLQSDYPVPYGPVKTEDIIAVLNRIYTYLDASTPGNQTFTSSTSAIAMMRIVLNN